MSSTNCLLCGGPGRPQEIVIVGMTVIRMLCDPCRDWVSPQVKDYPTR